MAGTWRGSTYTGDASDENADGFAGREFIVGAGGDDTLNGLAEDDTLQGDAGSDVLVGGDGEDSLVGDDAVGSGGKDDDRLSGGSGDDTVVGGLGRDVLSGGAGDDRVSLRLAPPGGDRLDLAADRLDGGAGVDVLGVLTFADFPNAVSDPSDGAAVMITLGAKTLVRIGKSTVAEAIGFERLDLELSGEGDHSVTGGAGGDRVTLSLGGRDKVNLAGGDDTLALFRATGVLSDAPSRAAAYDGGSGVDRLEIETRNSAATVISFDGAAFKEDDVVVASIRNFESVRLSASGSSDLRFSGLAGDDVARGGAGDDRLRGLSGDDYLVGNAGGDTLDGGAGADTLVAYVERERTAIDGGTGTDRLSFSTALPSIVMTGTLASGEVKSGGAVVATLRGVESIDLAATLGDDVLFGGGSSDSFFVGAGRDALKAGGGNDTVFVSLDAKRDVLDLGAGIDDLTLEAVAGAGAVVMTGTSANLAVTLGGASAALLRGAERFDVRAGAGNDRLLGGGLADTLSGGAGADTLSAGAGDDILMVKLDGMKDSLAGGAGVDLYRLGQFDLQLGGAALVSKVTSSSAFELRLAGALALNAVSVERVELYGTPLDDALSGLALDDRLIGAAGSDTLNGGGGDDFLDGGADLVGVDRLIGGSGADTVTYESLRSDSPLAITLLAGKTVTARIAGVASDTLNGVENLQGSRGNDVLTGDAGANVFAGNFGADTLDGGGGIDTVDFSLDLARVHVVLRGATASRATLDIEQDTIRNFENVIGTKRDDIIGGDAKANRLEGGGGADTLTGGGGADAFVYDDPLISFRSNLPPDTNEIKDLSVDLVTDFSVSGGDVIDVARVDADTTVDGDQAFAFLGGRAFSGRAAEARVVTEAGGTTAYFDVDGDKAADLTIHLDDALALTKSDFVL